jgi:hypothetical protein
LKGYDEPEILLYPLSRNCLIGPEPGHAPGEQFEYVRRLANAEEAQACLASLPKFGPDDASNHGFELTGRAIIN